MTIYAISRISGHGIYIGQTGGVSTRRCGDHLRSLRKNSHCNPALQASFNKYGEQEFQFDEIEECATREECNQSEKFFINHLRFLGAKVFNIEPGGFNGGHPHTEATRRKMSLTRKGNISQVTKDAISKSLKGRVFSEETRRKISLAKRAQKIPMPAHVRAALTASIKGKPLSDEHKRRLSQIHTGRPMPESTKLALKKVNYGHLTRSPEVYARQGLKLKGRPVNAVQLECLRIGREKRLAKYKSEISA